jgi:hypothetical protein
VFPVLINLTKMKFIRYIIILFFIPLVSAGLAQGNSNAGDTSVSFKVFGVCAGLCKPRIDAAAIGKGVKSAVWNVDTKILAIVYEPSKTSLEKIENRIVEAGHDLENKKANDAVYNALPSCCHYREIESMQDATDMNTPN